MGRVHPLEVEWLRFKRCSIEPQSALNAALLLTGTCVPFVAGTNLLLAYSYALLCRMMAISTTSELWALKVGVYRDDAG